MLAATAFVVSAAGCGSSSAAPAAAPAGSPPATSSPTTGGAGRLTPVAAKAIVTRLWSRRESALAMLSTASLAPIETGAALAEDRGYVEDVRCGCGPQKDGHTIVSVLPEIPRSAPQQTFFAQVKTANSADGDEPWYVLAFVHGGSGWRIAYVNFGGYKDRPPLAGLRLEPGSTAAVTAGDHARMVHIAVRELAWAQAHAHHPVHTNYGATVRFRAALHLGTDGVYGLSLPGGRVLSCYTLHELDTYSLPGGLAQGESRQQWGQDLAPGAYRRIVADTDQPECAAGTGRGAATPTIWLQYTPQRVAVTGTPLG
jgi:hypothetical protein